MTIFFVVLFVLCFFLIHPPPTEIYTLSLHDALPISNFLVAQAVDPPRARATSGTATKNFRNMIDHVPEILRRSSARRSGSRRVDRLRHQEVRDRKSVV